MIYKKHVHVPVFPYESIFSGVWKSLEVCREGCSGSGLCLLFSTKISRFVSYMQYLFIYFVPISVVNGWCYCQFLLHCWKRGQLTLKMPRKSASKMSSVYVVCWIFLQTFQTYFCIQANGVDPNQTAPRGVWSGSTLFAKMTFKITSRWQSRRQLLWWAV